MQTLIHMALASDGTVVAHFMDSADAAAFCTAKELPHVPYNLTNRNGVPAPVVGSIYHA